MKKYIAVLLVTCFFKFGIAQVKKDSIPKKERKWSMNLSINPNYSNTSNGNQYDTPLENPYYGVGAGISFGYRFNKTISIIFGIAFDEYISRSPQYDTILINPANNTLAQPVSQLPSYDYLTNARYYYEEQCISIPVGIKLYLWNHNNFSILGKLGFSWGSLTESDYIEDATRNTNINDYTPVFSSIAVNFNIGICYKFSSRMSLDIEPGFTNIVTYGESTIYNVTSQTKIYSYNINVSWNYKL